MNIEELYEGLRGSRTLADANRVLSEFLAEHEGETKWEPVGRENNRGTIEAAGDPGRSLVERLTNGIDAVLEMEHSNHGGKPDCRSPKEAAVAWLGVPVEGLSGMTPVERRALAKRVTISLLDGEGKDSRTVDVRDEGVGLSAADMPKTILSLGEGNKLQKHYLAGAYGQGGSSTFVSSKLTLIASSPGKGSPVAFTVIRYEDLPPEEYKTGRYVYLTVGGSIPTALDGTFGRGTFIRHLGYDLSQYGSPLGPNSLYGLLNQTLFDPPMPIWLENHVHDYNRVIKGSRSALYGARDEGDEGTKGPELSHKMPMSYVSLGDFGRIGIEYWVLAQPEEKDKSKKKNKHPSAAFVDPKNPFVLTLQGQNQHELGVGLLKKDAELAYLTQRFIAHIDCNALTPIAKRQLFVSNREGARKGAVLDMIRTEIIAALKSDEELERLNQEARARNLHSTDENALQEMRREVARLLNLQGIAVENVGAGSGTGTETRSGRKEANGTRKPRKPAPPIPISEPPTFIHFVADPSIEFHADQRRYVRVETDANSTYHDPSDPAKSRINLIVVGGPLVAAGTTPLVGGRMRGRFQAPLAAAVGAGGKIRVELSRPGMTTLSDERDYTIVKTPEKKQDSTRANVPQWRPNPISPEDEQWGNLGWTDDVAIHASDADMENGELVIHYSKVFPPYENQRRAFEKQDPALAESFTRRFETWLAVHSLIFHQDEQAEGEKTGEEAEKVEREERCRIARLAVVIATREIKLGVADQDD